MLMKHTWSELGHCRHVAWHDTEVARHSRKQCQVNLWRQESQTLVGQAPHAGILLCPPSL